MSFCDRNKTGRKAEKRAPAFVPLMLVAAGVVLLPFDCVYNQIFALGVIGVGAYSIGRRTLEAVCRRSHSDDATPMTGA